MSWVDEHCKLGRERLGLSQEEFSIIVRIPSAKISRAENGAVSLTDEEARRVIIGLRNLELLKQKYLPIPIDFSNLDWVVNEIAKMNAPVLERVEVSGKTFESVIGGLPGDGEPVTPEQAQKLLDEYAREQKRRTAPPAKKSARAAREASGARFPPRGRARSFRFTPGKTWEPGRTNRVHTFRRCSRLRQERGQGFSLPREEASYGERSSRCVRGRGSGM